ncbi:MAG: sigma 54-interacting transcriptional regulator [Oligoflexia bacterium]|nr:sigma 54-interacting transcriptional regulator [Oligoflexia bacterium]
MVGENGVGKNELAKYYYSILKEIVKFRPFFRVKSSSLNADNFKSTFFGSAKNRGIIEVSDRAVVLLQEIKHLNENVQHLILSLLKDKTFTVNRGIKKDNNVTYMDSP